MVEKEREHFLLRLPHETRKAVRRAAAMETIATGESVSMTAIIVTAVDEYLARRNEDE